MLNIKNEIAKVTSFKDLGALPKKSLTEKPEFYPMRFPVPDKYISWENDFIQYDPSKALATSSNASKAQELSLSNGISKSFEGEIEFDEQTQLPKNITGRTGIKGAGNLYNFGPNHAADTLLFSGPETNGQYKALLIKRKDGAWAMPGGFVDPNEDSRDAAIRELGEEALKLSDSEFEDIKSRSELVYQGYVDDFRNTDNAWIETSLYSVHLEETELASYAQKMRAADDAVDARVFTVDSELLDSLFASHGKMIRLALHNEGMHNDFFQTQKKIIHSLHDLPIVNAKRIGIYGGSFDPLHDGHIDAAEAALKANELDCVLFIPAGQNPLKEHQPFHSDTERLRSIERKLSGYAELFVLPNELFKDKEGEPSYAYQTLRTLSKQKTENQSLHFIVGADAMRELHKWKNYEECTELAEFIPIKRNDFSRELVLEASSNLSDKMTEKLYRNFVAAKTARISSSEIRAKVNS